LLTPLTLYTTRSMLGAGAQALVGHGCFYSFLRHRQVVSGALGAFSGRPVGPSGFDERPAHPGICGPAADLHLWPSGGLVSECAAV